MALKYQREVLPLKLLLTGLTVAVIQDPRINCLTGTVTISGTMPDLYKSLTVYFLQRDFALPSAEDFALPTHPYSLGFLRVNPEELLSGIPRGDIDAFDRLLGGISDGKYRLPVLFRKYFNCGARVSCFNVDPDFNDCLDGMIVLKTKDFPLQMLKSIIRPLPAGTQEIVLNHFYGSDKPE